LGQSIRHVIGTDEKVLPIPSSAFPNGINYRLLVDDQERHENITRH
jgi:hypothetical protein